MSFSQNAQPGHSDQPPIDHGPTPIPPTTRRPNKKPNLNNKPPQPPKPQTPTTPTPPSEDQRTTKRLLKRLHKTAKTSAQSHLILTAAQSTLTLLHQHHGLSCAIFGSLACKLYGGEFRHPKDVDVLVFQPPTGPETPPYSDEELKKLIVDADPIHYFLKLPRNPSATYRILYYRQDQLKCKVDILTPGTMHLPNLPSPPPPPQTTTPDSPTTSSLNNKITTISNIPLIPFSLLLLHKLQGWSDHRSAPEQFKRHKQHQDAADIRKLLAMQDSIKPLQRTRPWTDTHLFSPEFQALTKQRVKDYCKEFPARAESWKFLGFETE